MIDDMTLRGFGQSTQRSYIAAVRRCTAHVRKPPAALGAEDARAFLLHLQASGASVASLNNHSVALRFFRSSGSGTARPAQQFEQKRRELGGAILVTLALLDTDRHLAAVDIRYLERDHLGGAQASAIGHAQGGADTSSPVPQPGGAQSPRV
jgi:hypothetical protein